MPFIESILPYGSLSIIGMEKNTGKTETLNYILRRLPASVTPAVTSIGTDGELRDIVTGTAKPEIFLRSGTLFATAERYYARRKLTAEIVGVDQAHTAAGRVVTARVITSGKVMLSGPSSSGGIERWIDEVRRFGAELTITDGALSRKSSAAAAMSEAIVLATGAAFSANPAKLVSETAYTVKLISLPKAEESLRNLLHALGRGGTWGVDKEGQARELAEATPLSGRFSDHKALDGVETVYIPGAITDRMLESIRSCNPVPAVVAEDFTKIFVTRTAMAAWERKGGRIYVMNRSHLAAITVNPVSPSGVTLDSEMLAEMIEQETGIAAYDIRKCDDVR